jgi:hypothetical protein
MRSKKTLRRATNGEYRVSVGQHSRDGKREYKQFRLGKNLFVAQQISKALELAWAAETATDSDGKKVWSQQSIDKAFAFAEPPVIDQAQAPSQTAAQPAPNAKGLTLFQAFDLFENEQKDRFQAKEIGESHFASFGYRIKALKKHSGAVFRLSPRSWSLNKGMCVIASAAAFQQSYTADNQNTRH